MKLGLRIVVGGALIVAGAEAIERGFDLLTHNPQRVIKAAEDATQAAADVPHPFTQEGTP